jgi:hypothetical protein
LLIELGERGKDDEDEEEVRMGEEFKRGVEDIEKNGWNGIKVVDVVMVRWGVEYDDNVGMLVKLDSRK